MILLNSVGAFLTALDTWDIIYILLLAAFLGVEVISNVPAILHTPLMSGANAIHGVVIIGSIIVMGHADPDNYVALVLGFLALASSLASNSMSYNDILKICYLLGSLSFIVGLKMLSKPDTARKGNLFA